MRFFAFSGYRPGCCAKCLVGFLQRLFGVYPCLPGQIGGGKQQFAHSLFCLRAGGLCRLQVFRRVCQGCSIGSLQGCAMACGALLQLGLTSADYLIAAVGVVIMFAVSCIQEKRGSVREVLWKKPVLCYGVFFVLAVAVLTFGAYGVGYDATQFIYNQF